MNKQTWRNVFVGREKELNDLQDAWGKAKNNEPQFVTFLAETGVGKTRLVQHFYSWLNEKEDSNDYWPNTLEYQGASLSVNPSFSDKVGHDGIPWLWWGLRATDPTGRNKQNSSGCAIQEGASRLQPHVEPIILTRQKNKLTKSSATAIATPVLNMASFGTFEIAMSLYDLWGMRKEEKQRQEDEKRTARQIGEQKEAEASDIVFDYLRTVLNRKDKNSVTVPVILVLDDAQWMGMGRESDDPAWMDRETLRFVELLWQAACRNKWPLMIVATHWLREWRQDEKQTEASPADQPPSNLVDLTRRNALLFNEWNPTVLRTMRGNILQPVLNQALPDLTEKQQITILARVDGNPQFLDDLIRWMRESPRKFFGKKDSGLPLTKAGEKLIGSLGSGDKGHLTVIRQRFSELEEELRDLLGFGSYQGMKFLEPLTVEVVGKLYGDDDDDWSKCLAMAVDPYAVVDRVSEVVSEFRQRNLFEVAQEHLKECDEEEFRDTLLSVLKQWYDSGRIAEQPVSEREKLLQLLARELESSPEDVELLIRVQMELLELYSDEHRSFDAANLSLQMLETMPECGWPQEVVSFDQQNSLALALTGFSHNSEAMQVCTNLLEQMQQSDTQDSTWKNDLASAHLTRGDLLSGQGQSSQALVHYNEAISIINELRDTLGEQFSPEWQASLACVHMGRGNLLQGQGQSSAALADYNESIRIRSELRDTLGEQFPPVWQDGLAAAHMNRGALLKGQGQFSEALVDYNESIRIGSELRDTMGEQFPPAWQYSLTTAHMNRGNMLKGQSSEALADYNEVVG